MGKQCGVCTGLPAIPACWAGELPRKAVYCGWQDKAKEWGEERKSLALPMKMKGFILNPGRSVSLYQVRTSPAQECWPCQVGLTHGFTGHWSTEDASKKGWGQSCPWEGWRRDSVAIRFLLGRGLPSPWISASASRAVNTITAHKTTQLSSESCSNA